MVKVRPLSADAFVEILVDGDRKEGDDQRDLPEVFMRKCDVSGTHGDPFNITGNGPEDHPLELVALDKLMESSH